MELVILQSSRRSMVRRKFGIEEGKWKWWRQKRTTPLDYSAIFMTQLVVRCNAIKGRKMKGRKWHPRSWNVDGERWLNRKEGPRGWFLVVAIDLSTREKRQEMKPCGRMQCIFWRWKGTRWGRFRNSGQRIQISDVELALSRKEKWPREMLATPGIRR